MDIGLGLAYVILGCFGICGGLCVLDHIFQEILFMDIISALVYLAIVAGYIWLES